jgi:hypothetical protein
MIGDQVKDQLAARSLTASAWAGGWPKVTSTSRTRCRPSSGGTSTYTGVNARRWMRQE